MSGTTRHCVGCAKVLAAHPGPGHKPRHCGAARCRRISRLGHRRQGRTLCGRCREPLEDTPAARRATICGLCQSQLRELESPGLVEPAAGARTLPSSMVSAALPRVDYTTPEPPPQRTDSPEVWPLIIADLQGGAYSAVATFYGPLDGDLSEAARQRHEFGLRKYGVGLQVENGRRPLRDLLDEALDACAYSRQWLERLRHNGASSKQVYAARLLHEKAVALAALTVHTLTSLETP